MHTSDAKPWECRSNGPIGEVAFLVVHAKPLRKVKRQEAFSYRRLCKDGW